MGHIKKYEKLLDLLEQQREMIEAANTFSEWQTFETIRTEMVRELEDLIDMEPTDQITRAVMNKLVSRSNKGVRTYSQSMDRNDLSEFEWLCHLHEELLDGVLYNEKVIQLMKQRLNIGE